MTACGVSAKGVMALTLNCFYTIAKTVKKASQPKPPRSRET